MTALRRRVTKWARRASTRPPLERFLAQTYSLGIISATVTRSLHCVRGAAGDEEAADATGDRRPCDATFRHTRVRARHGSGGGRSGRRLREDRLQLLPDEGRPLLR